MIYWLRFILLLLGFFSIRLLRYMILCTEELEEVCVKTDRILVYIHAIHFLSILFEEEREAWISVESLGAEVGQLRPCNVTWGHIRHHVLW